MFRFETIKFQLNLSLSARRAWIEMISIVVLIIGHMSLSARRAWIEIQCNTVIDGQSAVALRKESVDRNSTYVTRLPRAQVSLSARRAWIEITMRRDFKMLHLLSLSARRAWIEMTYDGLIASANFVALRKESVDRNVAPDISSKIWYCRSPQGERG